MGIALFGYCTKYIFSVLLVHYIRPSLFGDFNIAIRVLGVLTAFSLLGTHYASRRFLSRYLRRNEHDNLQNYIKWSVTRIRVSFVICTIIALSTYLIMHELHIWHIRDIRNYHLAVYMLWIAPLSASLTLFATYLLCAEFPVFYKLITNMLYFFACCIFLMVASSPGATFDSRMLVAILFASFALSIAITVLFTLKKKPHLFINIVRAFHSPKEKEVHPDWPNVSTLMAMNGLIAIVIASTDLLLVRIIAPNEDSVGLYAVALTIGSFLLLIPQNMYSSLSTQVHELYHQEGGAQRLEERFKHTNKYMMFTTLFIATGMLLGSKTLLLHFGMVYSQAQCALIILIIGFTMNAYSQSAVTLLLYAGFEKMMQTILINQLIALVTLCTALTYFFGITGTAIAVSLVLTCRTIACHIIAYRKTKIKTYVF